MSYLDITGIVETGMWKYPDPYPPVRIEDLPPIEWVDGPCFSQALSLSAQSGTYLETWAHWERGADSLEATPIENFFLDTVILQIPKDAGEAVTRREVIGVLRQMGEEIHEGEAVLIATGWDTHWDSADFFHDPPFLQETCMQWIVDQKPTLIGVDSPRWVPPDYDYQQTASFFRRFLRGTGNTILVCPVNLREAPATRAKLVALPLRLRGTVASPCRAVLIFDDSPGSSGTK